MPEILTPAEARARGQKWYFLGGACPKGHVAKRTLRGSCFACRVEEQRRRRHRKSSRRVPNPHSAEHLAAMRARSREATERRLARTDWDRAVERLRAGDRLQDVFGLGQQPREDGMPSQAAWYKRVKSDPEFAARTKTILEGRPGVQLGEATILRVREHLAAGHSIASLAGQIGRRWTVNGLYKRFARDEAFASRRLRPVWNPTARLIAERRAERLRLKDLRKADRFAPERPREQFVAALRSDEIYAAVHAATRNLPREIREDVAGDLVVAVLDGEVAVADLAREVGRYRAAHNRMFGIWAPSLDAPIGDGGFTIGTSLAASFV